MEIQDTLNTIVDDHESINGKDADPKVLTNNVISDLLLESGVPEEISAKIEKSYTEEFGDTPPVADNLLDSKTLAKNEQRKKEKRLEKQVEILKNKLERTQSAHVNNEDVTENNSDSNDSYVNNESMNSQDNSSLESSIDELTQADENSMEEEAVEILKNINNSGSIGESTAAMKSEHGNSLDNINADNMNTEVSEAASDLDNSDNTNNESNGDYDIVLKVKPEKVEQIKYQIIDGKKYLVIPVDDDEQANVNGVDRVL